MGNYFKKIEHLHAGLLHLYIWNNGFEEIGGLPPMLETLQIVSNKILSGPQITYNTKKTDARFRENRQNRGLTHWFANG